MVRWVVGLRWKVKRVVDGECFGEPVVLNQYLSFFGEVDPAKGVVKTDAGEVGVAGKVLVFKGSRGSTVGSYIIYALRKNNVNPHCMIVKEVEPILIAGCVLAGIPLLVAEDFDEFSSILSSKKLVIHKEGEDYVTVE
ncbi:aconitase X swivel domain-containing protein [Thermosphaera sp.]